MTYSEWYFHSLISECSGDSFTFQYLVPICTSASSLTACLDPFHYFFFLNVKWACPLTHISFMQIWLQSVLPGILQGDKSDSLLYGSVDNGKKICWNEDFHSKVIEHLKFWFISSGCWFIRFYIFIWIKCNLENFFRF